MYGEHHGLEVYANWKPSTWWTVSPGYAFERIHLHLKPASKDLAAVTDNGEGTPVNSAQLRSHVVLPLRLSWDASAYFTEELLSPKGSSYTRLDVGLTWQCKEELSLSAFGQNLLQSPHLEFVDSTGSARSTLIPRSACAKIIWRF
jgi:hypothetical protein